MFRPGTKLKHLSLDSAVLMVLYLGGGEELLEV